MPAETPRPSWLPDPQHGNEELASTWLFRLRKQRYRSRKTGKSHDYFVMELADAVSVIAVTPGAQVVLVRQFRAGSGRDSLETPGGLLEPGEDPIEAGVRELLEETGYSGGRPRLLGTVWSNPSIMTSRTATIVVPDARRVREPAPDADEELDLELMPAAEIPAAITDGRIDHALSVVGLFWWLSSAGDAAGSGRLT